MTCNEVATQLPWLVNDRLTEGERAQVIAHLSTCEACRNELAETAFAFRVYGQHPSSQALAAWIFEQPTEQDLHWIREHVEQCEDCAEQVALLRQSKAFLDADVVPLAPRSTRSAVPLWRQLAVAASLLAVVGFGAFHLGQNRPSVGADGRPIVAMTDTLANVPVVHLDSQAFRLRGSDEEDPAVGSERSDLTLIVLTPYPENVDTSGEARIFDLEIHDRNGDRVHTASGLRFEPGSGLTFLLGHGLLRPGTYTLLLFDAADLVADRRPVDHFELQIRD